MISPSGTRTELRIYSHNILGLNPEKEHEVRLLIDQLDLDVVFLQETFNSPPHGSKDMDVIMYSKAGQACIEYTNARNLQNGSRRGIQFRVRDSFEPLVITEGCVKTDHAEILTICIRGIFLIGAYLPTGSNRAGLDQLLDVINEVEIHHHADNIMVLGDLNTKGHTLGNLRTNGAGAAFDSWYCSQETFILHQPEFPTFTRGTYHSFLDVLLFKGPVFHSPVVKQALLDYSDHTSFMVTTQWYQEETCPTNRPVIKPRDLNSFLKRYLEQHGELSLEAFQGFLSSKIPKTKSVKSPGKRSRSFTFERSTALKKLGKRLHHAKRSGDQSAFAVLRATYSHLFRQEKRADFKRHLEDVLKAPNIAEFCALLRRTSPKPKWNVNAADRREDAVALELTQVQLQRPELKSFIEQTRHSLATGPSSTDPHLIQASALGATLKTRKKRKSPGPSGLTYDTLQALDPSLTKPLAQALSVGVSSGALPHEWFRLYVKPLCKKPGQPQTRPISLLETMTKIVLPFPNEL